MTTPTVLTTSPAEEVGAAQNVAINQAQVALQLLWRVLAFLLLRDGDGLVCGKVELRQDVHLLSELDLRHMQQNIQKPFKP